MSVASDVEERGFAIVERVVNDDVLDRFRAILDRRQPVAGVRNLLDVVPETRDLVAAADLRRLLAGIVSAYARIVRATLFDKSAGACCPEAIAAGFSPAPTSLRFPERRRRASASFPPAARC